jgi:M6 family metalloprotease-like protein
MTRSHFPVLFALLAVLLLSTSVMAMPPSPSLLDAIQQQLIDEPYFLQEREALLERGVNTPHFVNLNQGELDETIFNSIVLLVDFSDHQAVTNGSFFDNLMYGGGTGTVADYYDEVSFGDFELTTQDFPSTIGWLRMPHTYGYYVDGQNGFGSYPNNAQGLAEDAVLAADPFVDFSQYDHDNDGRIDGLFIMHAGTGAELSGNDNDIWSHKWQINGGVDVDGVEAYVYAMQPEFWYSSGDMTIGVVAHEMGHAVFYLPDLYDYGYDSRGLDAWSLMSGGSWGGALGSSPAHPDAWSRVAMGFVTPVNVTFDVTNEAIPSVNENGVIYRLWTQGQMGNQYFLVENRRQWGYDTSLPSQGLLIYHCDDSEHGNNNQWYPGHTNDGNYQVALEQADGLWELEQNSYADSGDPFPGSTTNRTFNGNTTPDSDNYNFQNTQVAVTNISNAASTMSADFTVGVAGGPLFDVTLTPNGAPITIPPGGGNINFAALITNTLPSAQQHNVWIEADMPNGNVYHVQTYTLNFQPGVPFSRPSVNQNVPAMAPAGAYNLRVEVGTFPNTVLASDQFPFTKSAFTSDVSAGEDSWETNGLDPSEDGSYGVNTLVPSEFNVGQAYPNPFNAQTLVTVSLPTATEMNAVVFNTLGQQVLTLTDGLHAAGEHRLSINASDLTSGIYFLHVTNGELSVTRKLVLMK